MTFDAEDIVRLVLWAFGAALLLSLILTVVFNKTSKSRVIGPLKVLVIFAGIVGFGYYKIISHPKELAQEESRREGLPTTREEVAERDAKAKALLEERCKTAGEKVLKTIENVEGFVWQRWRPEINLGDQYALTDPYGWNCSAAECIKGMLRATEGIALNPQEAGWHERGYRFIESADPKDGVSYRYTGVIRLPDIWTPEKIAEENSRSGQELSSSTYRFVVERQPVGTFAARYGVIWDDVSTPEDRKYWIAGGVLRIVDLKTGELIAERTGYLMDPLQGSRDGFRTPWTWVRSSPKASLACPPISGHNLEFIRTVLKPKQEN